MLDGDVVKPGDAIFDLFLGTGSVTEVMPDGAFVARFGADRKLRYSPGGTVSGAKRAFWRDPVLVTPRKGNAEQWALFKRLIEASGG
jgi:hypothetical protein